VKALLFSVGKEMFASPLSTVEESVDRPAVHPMPGSDSNALGVVDLRGRRLAAYSPAGCLNAPLGGDAGAALIIGDGPSAIALLVTDVDDVVEIDPRGIRVAPGSEDADGILLGIFKRGGRLVSVVDPHAIREFCLSDAVRA